jgi:hypothetical protein
MQKLGLVIFLAILSGCQTKAPRVRCDAKLQPINAPAPIVKEPAATSTTP